MRWHNSSSPFISPPNSGSIVTPPPPPPSLSRRSQTHRKTPNGAYELILLDVRRHLPGEALEFYEQIRNASPKEHFAFFVGPPVYLSRTWPGEATVNGASQGQWQATVRRFLTAA